MLDINILVRENIRLLKPYSSAREEYKGDEAVFLDANENPFNAPYNRYPDPLQRKLKDKIAEIKNISASNIFLGNGSDEPIDLLIRIFCEPKQDNILSFDPTYGMYEVAAGVNNVEYRKVKLNEDFTPDVDKLLDQVNSNTKIIFICSPNNPTGNSLGEKNIEKILKTFKGIIVIDEAYIDFAVDKGFLAQLNDYPNLVILQTFSKAWGMASVRLGIAFANKVIIDLFNKIKFPYNINLLTQQFAIDTLLKTEQKDIWVKEIIKNRELLINELKQISLIKKIYPSDANFFLVKVDEPNRMYNYLVNNKIIVRNRSNVTLCEGCLRLTVGTKTENQQLIKLIKEFK